MSATTLRVGLVQLRSGVDPAANLAAVEKGVHAAAAQGARLIATPEASNLLQRDDKKMVAAVRPADGEPAIARLAALADELDVWLLAGSLMVAAEDGRAANRAHLFAPDGRLVATYDKMHLFDVELGGGEAYKESRAVAPGHRAVVAETPWGGLGMTICYDVRFPQLYRALARAGADIIAIPAAFTRTTGEAHWETLLRARAIETGAFVIAPAQGGAHEDGRATWGRSTVVDPWGQVIARLDGDAPGVLIADLDLAAVAAARGKIPSLAHDREFEGP